MPTDVYKKGFEMRNLVTLNLKYLMEGREDELQEDMEKFVDDLISVCKDLNEDSRFISSGCTEDYIDDLVSKYPNGRYMVNLCGEVLWGIEYFNENKVRLKLNRKLGYAYHKAVEIYEVLKEFVIFEGKNDFFLL